MWLFTSLIESPLEYIGLSVYIAEETEVRRSLSIWCFGWIGPTHDPYSSKYWLLTKWSIGRL